MPFLTVNSPGLKLKFSIETLFGTLVVFVPLLVDVLEPLPRKKKKPAMPKIIKMAATTNIFLIVLLS